MKIALTALVNLLTTRSKTQDSAILNIIIKTLQIKNFLNKKRWKQIARNSLKILNLPTDVQSLQIFVGWLAGDSHAKRLSLLSSARKNSCRRLILIKLKKENWFCCISVCPLWWFFIFLLWLACQNKISIVINNF